MTVTKTARELAVDAPVDAYGELVRALLAEVDKADGRAATLDIGTPLASPAPVAADGDQSRRSSSTLPTMANMSARCGALKTPNILAISRTIR